MNLLLLISASLAQPYIGAKIGWPQPVGLQATIVNQRWEADLLIEPSMYWQSVSLGAAYYPFDNPLTVGARVRWLQLHAPWGRGYNWELDNATAAGVELGGRWPLLKDRAHLKVAIGFTASPWGPVKIPPLITADVGFAYKLNSKSVE